MKLKTVPMDVEIAMSILNWKYDKPYDFYNNELTEEALHEFINGNYFTIVDERERLIGFYCTGTAAQVPAGNRVEAYKEEKLDIGFGMNPVLTGQGKGYSFCDYIFKTIGQNSPDLPQRLTVATFNKRAIHLYKKFGFKQENEFNTERATFITMTRNKG
ncbi:GNAT family N-acetyltransferase [Virgibacillus sp. SK37]|uniref:GNAT family N-acetyltransferase n=1 Tax=Virgibacillus sp. SK37 TaxID=403957 RepID=UPI0004D0B0CF|nr:GNAT family protein [Virgibacillus sp. SK37]AIF42587.1 acetyltransferase [Virgibacillus sp. SK37]